MSVNDAEPGLKTGKPLTAAVVGAGRISQEHLEFLAASDRAHLAGVCDLSPALASYAKDRFNADRAMTDLDAMLKELHPDVVHVLTPPHTHVPIATACLDAGSHVIIEKPITASRDALHELCAHASRCDRRIVEDHNYRFNAPWLRIEEMVKDGRLGAVREIEIRLVLNVRSGGRYADTNLVHPSHELPAGIIHEFITHLAYLSLRFVPSVDRVAAAWSCHGEGGPFKYDDLDATVIGGDVHARLRFTAHQGPDTFSVIVRGTRGWVETDLFLPYHRVVCPRIGGSQVGPLVNHVANGFTFVSAGWRGFWNKVLQRNAYDGLGRFLDQSYAALQQNGALPVSFDDMDRTSHLVEMLVAEENRI